MKYNTGWLIATSLLLSSAAIAQDCDKGKQSLARAQDQMAASHPGDAADLLRQSIADCPSYDLHQR